MQLKFGRNQYKIKDCLFYDNDAVVNSLAIISSLKYMHASYWFSSDSATAASSAQAQRRALGSSGRKEPRLFISASNTLASMFSGRAWAELQILYSPQICKKRFSILI